jgi:hypothetical protein
LTFYAVLQRSEKQHYIFSLQRKLLKIKTDTIFGSFYLISFFFLFLEGPAVAVGLCAIPLSLHSCLLRLRSPIRNAFGVAPIPPLAQVVSFVYKITSDSTCASSFVSQNLFHQNSEF